MFFLFLKFIKIFKLFLAPNSNSFQEYNSEFLARVYGEEGKGVFTVRHNVLGHMQVSLALKIIGKTKAWTWEHSGIITEYAGLPVNKIGFDQERKYVFISM